MSQNLGVREVTDFYKLMRRLMEQGKFFSHMAESQYMEFFRVGVGGRVSVVRSSVDFVVIGVADCCGGYTEFVCTEYVGGDVTFWRFNKCAWF